MFISKHFITDMFHCDVHKIKNFKHVLTYVRKGFKDIAKVSLEANLLPHCNKHFHKFFTSFYNIILISNLDVSSMCISQNSFTYST